MDKIVDFLMDNKSNTTSTRNIANILTSNEESINYKTISKYLICLCNAFGCYKIRWYDIHGKKYLTSNEKY